MIPTAKTSSRCPAGRPACDAQVEGAGGTWSQHVPVGRISELTGGGAVSRTTLAISLVATAQSQGETCAWVQSVHSPNLFAPDLEQAGVDLEALPIVRVPALMREVLKASELLLRSGGFGVVVVDLSTASARVPMAALARLQGLAREHQARLVFLTPAAEEALGSPVSVRVRPERSRASAGFLVEPNLLRDKAGVGGFDPQAFAAPLDASLLDRVVEFPSGRRVIHELHEPETIDEIVDVPANDQDDSELGGAHRVARAS